MHFGSLDLFKNYDPYGNRLSRPNTILIDSAQLESGEALDKEFKAAAAKEIVQFQNEMRIRGASQSGCGKTASGSASGERDQ